MSDIIAASASHAVKMNVGNTAEWIRSFNVYRGKEQRLKQALSVLGPLDMDPMTASTWFEGSFVHIGYGKEKVIAAKLNEDQELDEVLEKGKWTKQTISRSFGWDDGKTKQVSIQCAFWMVV